MNELKACAIQFLQLAACGQAPQAFERYVATGFRHHNPHFPGDAGSLCDAMQDNARAYPAKVLQVQRTLQDGQLVAVHSRVQLDEGLPSIAVVHILRFEAGRIVELWDVGAPEPEQSANQYGMF